VASGATVAAEVATATAAASVITEVASTMAKEDAAASSGADAAAAAAKDTADSGASSGAKRAANAAPKSGAKPGCSFAPQTPVLLDHGKTKPIGDLQIGDRVEAADPDTGQLVGPRTVTATFVNYDHDLVDVTVQGKDGKPFHTTSKHPFWDATTHAWVPAASLTPGHTLTTDKSQPAKILAVHTTPGAANRYN
jgi:hypothetical protein